MNKSYDNSMRGALFINTEKEELKDTQDTEKWCDYNGSCEIEGIKFWVSGWKKISKNGDKFLSLSFKRADAPKTKAQPNQSTRIIKTTHAVEEDEPF